MDLFQTLKASTDKSHNGSQVLNSSATSAQRLSSSEIYKQAAIQKLMKSISGETNKTGRQQDHKTSRKIVSFLVPISALKNVPEDAPASEIFAKAYSVKLNSNSDDEIVGEMNRFLMEKCTEEAVQDRDFVHNVYTQIKENYSTEHSVPYYVKHRVARGETQIGASELPKDFTRLSRLYDEQIGGYLDRIKAPPPADTTPHIPEINKSDVAPRYLEPRRNYWESSPSQPCPSITTTPGTAEKALEYRRKQLARLKAEIEQKFNLEAERARTLKKMEQERKQTDKSAEKPSEDRGAAENAVENGAGPEKEADAPFVLNLAELQIDEENPTFYDIQKLLKMKNRRSASASRNDELFRRLEEEKKMEEEASKFTYMPEISKDAKEKVQEITDVVQRLQTRDKYSKEKIRKAGIDLANKRAENETFRPAISEESAKIMDGKDRGNIYKRMLDEARVRKYVRDNIDRIAAENELANCTFAPVIKKRTSSSQTQSPEKRSSSHHQPDTRSPDRKNDRKDDCAGQIIEDFYNSFRDLSGELKAKNTPPGETPELYERLWKEGEEYARRKQQYQNWGESLSVLMANTVHTNKRSGLVLQNQAKALKLYDKLEQKHNPVTGNTILENLDLFEPALRRAMEDFGQYKEKEQVTAGAFVSTYLSQK